MNVNVISMQLTCEHVHITGVPIEISMENFVCVGVKQNRNAQSYP